MAIFATNRKANFNYEIKDKFECGIELFGHEVKSVKGGSASLDTTYVIIRGGEAYLVGAYIPPYQVNNTDKDYDPRRNRRLLLTKKEIRELEKVEQTKGLTIVALSLYNKGRKLKLEIGVGVGKKKFDKRETLKKRDTDRELRRDFKDR
jgi:SsrA-binding protein